jgi:hypothetical protein
VFCSQLVPSEWVGRAVPAVEPTRWRVTDVGHGRSIVSAVDPREWFTRQPTGSDWAPVTWDASPATLERAREDVAGILQQPLQD